MVIMLGRFKLYNMKTLFMFVLARQKQKGGDEEAFERVLQYRFLCWMVNNVGFFLMSFLHFGFICLKDQHIFIKAPCLFDDLGNETVAELILLLPFCFFRDFMHTP